MAVVNLRFGFTCMNPGSPTRLSTVAWLMAGTLLAAPAGAEPTKEAREASKASFVEARKLWDGGNYLEACAKFEESYQHAPSVGNLLNLGRCAERRGKLATAKRYFERSAEMAEADGEAERAKAARGLIAGLEPRLSKVEVTVDPQPEGLEVTLDGQPIQLGGGPVEVDPGEHRIAAYAPGYERDEERVEIQSEGELRSVALNLTKLPGPDVTTGEERGPGLLIGGIATAGVGAVGLVIGSVFGTMALGKQSDLEETCTIPSQCPRMRDDGTSFDAEQIKSDARQDATISTASFAVGGALVGVGLTLILVDVLTDDDSPPSDDVAFIPYLGLEGAGAGLHLRF